MSALLISVLAALVSLGSLILAYASSRRAHMPVLQFMWESGQGGGLGGSFGPPPHRDNDPDTPVHDVAVRDAVPASQ